MSGTLTPRGSVLPTLWREPRRGMLDEFEQMMSRLWGEGDEGWFSAVPSIDLSESPTAVEAKIDLPGVKPEEIDIQLNGNVLTISGHREEEKQEKEKTFHRLERRSGDFSRSFTLPCPVEEDEVAAEHRDGVLTITLPKTEEAKTRKIQVKS